MTNPELAGALIGVRERKARGERVRKKRRIEVETDTQSFRPVDPPAEMLRTNRITSDAPASKVTVRRMKIEPVLTRNQRQRLCGVLPQLVSRARFARVV